MPGIPYHCRLFRSDLTYTERKMQGYDTPHEALQAIERGVASGQFLNCSHLKYTLGGSDFDVIRHYFPVCEKDCFTNLEDPLHHEIGCPQQCRLFANRDLTIQIQDFARKLERRRAKWKQLLRRIGSVLAAPFI